MIIKLIEHHAQRASRVGGKLRIILGGALRSDRFKDLNDIEQSESFRIDGEPISPAHATSSINDSRASEIPQDFRQMMGGNAVFVGDFRARKLAGRISCKLEHGVEREASLLSVISCKWASKWA